MNKIYNLPSNFCVHCTLKNNLLLTYCISRYTTDYMLSYFVLAIGKTDKIKRCNTYTAKKKTNALLTLVILRSRKYLLL